MENLKDKENLLENFICDKNLKQLENNYKKFNIFDCLGLNRLKIGHSYFLKWLLDPYETHEINDSFLKIFLKNVLINKKAEIKNLEDRYIFPSIFNFDCWDMSNTEVDREIDNIDIKIVNKIHKFVCIIENKIDTYQHDNQLSNYRKLIDKQYPNRENWKKLFIYLKPKKDELIEKPYIYVDYGIVFQSLDELLNDKKDKINAEIFTIINHYKTILERDIMGSADLRAKCVMLYRKHHKAIDLINENINNIEKEYFYILREILESKYEAKEIGESSDNCYKFLPKGMFDKIPKNKDNHPILYLQAFWNKAVSLKLQVWLITEDNQDTSIFEEKIKKAFNTKRLNGWNSLLYYNSQNIMQNFYNNIVESKENIKTYIEEELEGIRFIETLEKQLI